MPRWNLALRKMALLLAFIVGLVGAPAVDAQVRIPSDALVNVPEVDRILRVGDQLEQERRWGEALSHYEEASRKHPHRRDLLSRLMLARMHYDVVRRYSDSSFVKSVSELTEREALDLYGEVLLKIDAHYVERPHWDELVRQSMTAISVAASEKTFSQRHQLRISPSEFRSLLDHLRSNIGVVDSRHDAREALFYIARQLQARFRLPSQATILEGTCAAAASLDPYSAYLSRNQMDDVLSQIEGNFVGLGIELKAEDQALLIVSVIPGGPAAAADLQAGDRIVRVDGHSTVDITTDVAADMLKGLEGTSVSLSVNRGPDLTRSVRLTRRRVEVPSVDRVEIVDPRYAVGYIRLASFQKNTNRDVEAALWKLHRQGMRSVIIDVRGNPGGLLTAAVEVADKFVSQGSIVSTRGRSAGENYEYRAHLVGTWRVPLIVLIDGDSASASEIFAGAIRDHGRGTIVGSRTYGKGSVQGIFPLNLAKAGIRLTTAKFYSPQGHPISRRGVQPDLEVHTAGRPLASAGELENEQQADSILQAGVQAARQLLGRR